MRILPGKGPGLLAISHHCKEASTSPHLDGTSLCSSRPFSETVSRKRHRRIKETASPANWGSDAPPDASRNAQLSRLS
jgi:hypothetical protein